jgi:cytochrome c553
MSPTSRLFLSLALAFAAAPAFAQGEADAGHLKVYTCSGCHGIPNYKNVYPTYNVPRIGGQNHDYLVAALTAYQKGDRKHPTMRAQAESFDAQAIGEIATYLSSLKGNHEPHGHPKGNADAGKTKAQTCQACHGADGNGTGDGQYPRLAGQHGDYLAKALHDYKSGARNNPIMKGFAATLSDEDIADLSAWFSSQESPLTDLSHLK